MSTDFFAELDNIGKPIIEKQTVEGKDFFVRSLGSNERSIYVQCMAQAIAEKSAVPDHVIVALGLCKEDGSPIAPFKAACDRLRPIEGTILYPLARKILELSGFGLKEMRRLEKNPTPAGTQVSVPAGAGAG